MAVAMCRNGLHQARPENKLPNGACRPCRQANDARKRERRKRDKKLQEARNAGTAKFRAWHRFNRLTTPTKKIDAAVELFLNQWVADADVPGVVEGIARARMQYLPERPAEPTQQMLDDALALLTKKVDDVLAAEKKNPLAHLNIKPDAERAWDRFNKALNNARLASSPEDRKKYPAPNCQNNPGPYADYDEENIPSAEDAYGLCFDCPLIALCSSYAEQERPAWGVWAGEAWAYGEIVNNE